MQTKAQAPRALRKTRHRALQRTAEKKTSDCVPPNTTFKGRFLILLGQPQNWTVRISLVSVEKFSMFPQIYMFLFGRRSSARILVAAFSFLQLPLKDGNEVRSARSSTWSYWPCSASLARFWQVPHTGLSLLGSQCKCLIKPVFPSRENVRRGSGRRKRGCGATSHVDRKVAFSLSQAQRRNPCHRACT